MVHAEVRMNKEVLSKFCTNQRLVLATVLFLAPYLTPFPAAAQSASELSQAVAQKEVELDLLTTQFHRQNNLSTIGKRRRQWVAAMANSAATEAGLIDATALFYKHSRHLNKSVQVETPDGPRTVVKGVQNKVPPDANAGQLYPQIIGQEINAFGNMFELSANAMFRRNCKRRALDPKTALQRAKSLTNDIDALLARRAVQLCEPTSPDNGFNQETKILLAVRSALVREFVRQYARARRELVWENTLELLDLTRNIIGATGNQTSVEAGYLHNKRLNGVGNMLSLISAVQITFRPYIAFAAARYTERKAMERASAELPGLEESQPMSAQQLREAIESLKSTRLAAAPSETPLLPVLSVEASLLKSQDQLNQDEERSWKSRAYLQMVRHSILGPTKIANEVLGTIVGFRNGSDSTKDNRLQATGALTYTIGQGANFLELWRSQIHDELENQKLKKSGRAPDQLLDDRIKTIEAQLRLH